MKELTELKQTDNTVFKDIIIASRQPDVLEQFQYNINTETLTTTVTDTGTVTQSNSMAVISSGAGVSATAKLESINAVRYRPGYEGFAYFTTLFETGGIANATQYAGIFDADDGFFVGYNGTDFVVGLRKNGSDTTVAFADWNGGDVKGRGIGDFDATKLNIFRITWGWLGTAVVRIELAQSDGTWRVCHEFQLPNTLTEPSIYNPMLPITVDIQKSSAAATDLVVKTASWCGGVIASFEPGIGDRYFTEGVTQNTVSSESVLLNIQNVSTFQSKTNKVAVQLLKLSMSTDGTKPSIIKIYKNLSISSASWSNVDATNSVMQTDTAGTVTPDDANLLMSYHLAKSDSILDEVVNLNFKLMPGDTVTVTGQSAANTDLAFTIRWKEKF